MACGKVILSAFKAHRALRFAKRHKSDRRHENRVYYCRHCSGHHLTSEIEYDRTVRLRLKKLRDEAGKKK